MSLAIILVSVIILQAILLAVVSPLMFYWLVLNKEEREEYKLIIKQIMEKK